MTALATIEARTAQVWAQISKVIDPELDESVVDLGFVHHVSVREGDEVHVGFRLPTYWCAANFSFLMADDIRRAVSDLPWSKRVIVVLDEHMYADQINNGLSKGLSFEQTFGEEADGDLDELRLVFLIKAFQRRQLALLDHMTLLGYSPDVLVKMTVSELKAAPLDDAGRRLVERYLDRLSAVRPAELASIAFVTEDGSELTRDVLPKHVSRLKSVDLNAEFNSMICRGLLAGRYADATETPAHANQSACAGQCASKCAGRIASAS